MQSINLGTYNRTTRTPQLTARFWVSSCMEIETAICFSLTCNFDYSGSILVLLIINISSMASKAVEITLNTCLHLITILCLLSCYSRRYMYVVVRMESNTKKSVCETWVMIISPFVIRAETSCRRERSR